MQRKTAWGTVGVSEEVLAAVADLALHSYAESSPEVTVLPKEPLGYGVEVGLDRGRLAVDCYIGVAFGHSIVEVGRQVSEVINHALWAAIDEYPGRLTVHVERVFSPR